MIVLESHINHCKDLRIISWIKEVVAVLVILYNLENYKCFVSCNQCNSRFRCYNCSTSSRRVRAERLVTSDPTLCCHVHVILYVFRQRGKMAVVSQRTISIWKECCSHRITNMASYGEMTAFLKRLYTIGEPGESRWIKYVVVHGYTLQICIPLAPFNCCEVCA